MGGADRVILAQRVRSREECVPKSGELQRISGRPFLRRKEEGNIGLERIGITVLSIACLPRDLERSCPHSRVCV